MADKSNIAIISVSQVDIIPSISKNAAQNFFCYFSNDLTFTQEQLSLMNNQRDTGTAEIPALWWPSQVAILCLQIL